MINRNTVISLISCGLLAACSGNNGKNGTSCTVVDTNNGVVVECTDGTTAHLYDGDDGPQGLPGPQGPQGDAGVNGVDGKDGVNGENVASLVAQVASHASSFMIVYCCDANNKCSSGSGTKTVNSTVMTAQHVVDDAAECLLLSPSDLLNLGSSTIFNSGVRDQAEMTVSWTELGAPLPGVVRVDNYQPLVGELSVVTGHPGVYTTVSYETQYTPGHVTAIDIENTLDDLGAASYWSNAWNVDNVVWHGNSGGAVFNDQGQWVGMLVGGYNGGSTNQGPDLGVVIPFIVE